MPIEVREVVIKATVSNDGSTGSTSGPSNTSDQTGEDMIKLCVEKVLEILKDKNER